MKLNLVELPTTCNLESAETFCMAWNTISGLTTVAFWEQMVWKFITPIIYVTN